MVQDRSAGTAEGGDKHRRRSHLLYNDYVVAGLLTALCILIFYFSTQIDRVPAGLAQGIQPASFPQGVLVTILGLILLMLYEAREHALETPEPVPGLAYKTILAMIASLAVVTWVDFFIGLIGFVVICIPMWGMRRIGVAIGYSLALHGVLFVMFSTFLQVRFPMGPLTGLMD